MDRQDGWPALKRAYALPHTSVLGLDHDIAYRQIEQGEIDVMDVYMTDAKIHKLQMTVLDDDQGFFPEYAAVVMYRRQLEQTHPDFVAALGRLRGRITAEAMTLLNARTDIDGVSESQAAAEFLSRAFDITPRRQERTPLKRIAGHTLEHLDLVRRSLIPAILLGVPLGIFAVKRPRLGRGILASAAFIQTIPALALLVLLIAPVSALGLSTVGRGSVTAVIALFLYSLLPIVRNTHAGFSSLSPQHRESALALGLSAQHRLWKIELPLASPMILAGIQTAAVINVGFATLGALIGAGGYGQPIMTGIRLNNTALIMQGALPAAAMALAVQGVFELAERFLVPRGLRLSSEV
jgi:osmoprotectant transport system permease protein